jgi:signal transduction histidine kinase
VSQVSRVAFAARVFTLAALVPMAVILGGNAPRGVVLVALVAAFGQLVSWSRRLPESWVAMLEGVAVAALTLSAPGSSEIIVPYLTVPVLVGGLAGRFWGLIRVACAEAILLTVGHAVMTSEVTRQAAARELLWIVTGVGLGLLGASIHRLLAESVTEASYRSALDLIRQLHELSGRLTDGLDAIGIADGVLEEACERLPLRTAALFTVGTNGAVTPLRYAAATQPEDLAVPVDRIEEVARTRTPLLDGPVVLVPLTRAGHVVAVLAGECATAPDRADVGVLDAALSAETLKLYAALMFSDVRDRATREERQRLAREVHDGIAQDVAGLGYLVDAVVPETPEQEESLTLLRGEVTRVVTELRLSVFDLRNDTGVGRGLGESLSAMARHIGARTTMTIHLTLDEAPTRLRPRVEAELLRIAQEAMNNARKHSGGDHLWVTCRVFPPEAEIVVRDDGSGLGSPRDDSHGLQIMRERAAAVGADLQIGTPEGEEKGTEVRVRLTKR